MEREPGHRVMYILGPAILVGGLIGWGAALLEYRTSLRSAAWPSVTGVVRASEVETSIQRRSSGPNRTSYLFSLRYEYTVDSQTYEGDRIRFGGYGDGTREFADAAVARFPVGAEVTVYYDPDDPGEAVLERGANTSAAITPFAVLVLLPVGLGLFLFNRPRHSGKTNVALTVGAMIALLVLFAIVTGVIMTVL